MQYQLYSTSCYYKSHNVNWPQVVKVADISLRQINYLKDDCSTSKLLRFSLTIGDFHDLCPWEPGLKSGSHIVIQSHLWLLSVITSSWFRLTLKRI